VIKFLIGPTCTSVVPADCLYVKQSKSVSKSQIIAFMNKNFQWFKFRGVLYFRLINNVVIETWMGNIIFDQISACSSGGFKGGFGGFSPPRRKSQAHILTYAFQGYLTSRYGF